MQIAVAAGEPLRGDGFVRKGSLVQISHRKCGGAAAMFLAVATTTASAGTLRVVEYNVNADTTDSNGFNNVPASTVETVLQAIGNHQLAGHAQPIDVLALTELQGVSNTTISPTLATITSDLNAVYGAGTYAYNMTIDPTDGPTETGNGPSGLIYNTKTIGSVTGTPIATTASSGSDPRVPMQYLIQPANATAASQFYLYVEHAKADQSSSDAATRANESVLVRQSADALGANANVIYSGDLNLAGGSNATTTSGSGEQSYKNLTAPAGSLLVNGSGGSVVAGPAQAVDPLSPGKTFTNNNAAYTQLFTESATDLTARFDLQLVSNSVSNGTNGLTLVPDTQTAFGSSYYNASGGLVTNTAYAGTVNTAANQSLSDLSNASTVYADLTQLTDHLPIVADYDFTSTPEPTTLLTAGAATATLLLGRRRHRAGTP